MGDHETMPHYMDVHRNVDADGLEAIRTSAHLVSVQERSDVSYERYWIDEAEGVAFCLFKAPSKARGEAVHREVHGLLADEIFEVTVGEYPQGGRDR